MSSLSVEILPIISAALGPGSQLVSLPGTPQISTEWTDEWTNNVTASLQLDLSYIQF